MKRNKVSSGLMKVVDTYGKAHSISTCQVCGLEISPPYKYYTLVWNTSFMEDEKYVTPIYYFCSEPCEILFRIGRGY